MKKNIPALSFSEALNASTSKIFQIQGRARRSEYWWTQLAVCMTNIVLTPFIGFILNLLTIPLTIRRLHDTGRSGWWWGIGVLLNFSYIIYILILIFDFVISTNYTGADFDALSNSQSYEMVSVIIKCTVSGFLVGIYQIILLIMLCLDSEPEPNKYGASPKYAEYEANMTENHPTNK